MSFLSSFLSIDLHKMWLTPYLPIHHAYAHKPTLPLFEWLNDYFATHHITPINHEHHPLSFTHQNDLEHGTAYEVHINTHHKIPTRDNLHDWFGACVWSVFPKSKSLLNAKHLTHISDDATANKRNRVRDTITVFDENGAILLVSDDEIGHRIGTSLQAFDWQNCLIKPRQYWSDGMNDTHKKAKVFIFGHALLEQLINPYKSLCGHAVVISVPSDFFHQSLHDQLVQTDDYLCQHLTHLLTDEVTPRNLNPLPILGVPHFWQNSDVQFYQDPFVFRGGRRSNAI